jgi:hypothetical protein
MGRKDFAVEALEIADGKVRISGFTSRPLRLLAGALAEICDPARYRMVRGQ